MAAVLTGTPTAITWASGINPIAQDINIPADATAVYMFWAYWASSLGAGLSSVTLAGNSPSQSYELGVATGKSATGVAAWYSPSTGTQSLDLAWDAAPEEGPVCIVAYVKDGNTSAWRDADADHNELANAVSVTLTTILGDLVIKFDMKYDAISTPSLSAGWTNGQTMELVPSEGCRLSYITATGVTQVCDSEDENYSSVCAISIPASSGITFIPQLTVLGAG